MDQTLKQAGELLLGAIPTVALLLLLYACYDVLIQKPLHRILEERRARTEGAVIKARADVALAEARMQEYEQRLREARVAIFKALSEILPRCLSSERFAALRNDGRPRCPCRAFPMTASPAPLRRRDRMVPRGGVAPRS